MEKYPTDDELSFFRTAKPTERFFELLYARWWAADWGWSDDEKHTFISTGGWSGNEDLIHELRQNRWFWNFYYLEERAGGHYKFKKFEPLFNANGGRNDRYPSDN